MSIDLKIDLGTKEIISSLNEIIKKYELPLSATEIVISSVLNSITNTKDIQLQEEKRLLELEKQKAKESKEKKYVKNKRKHIDKRR